MDIVVTGRKLNIGDKIKAYAEEKVASSMKVFDIDAHAAEIVLRKEQNPANLNPYVAEITLRVKGRVIRAFAEADDLQAAIDIAADKAARQLRKYKTQVVDKKSRTGKVAEAAPLDVDLVDLQAAIEAEKEEEKAVVRVKEIDLEPLSLDEALIQTDLLGHDFFVFIDDVTGLVNVIYRRKDGGYGLIKPKLEEAPA